jgi:hypothetical protein
MNTPISSRLVNILLTGCCLGLLAQPAAAAIYTCQQTLDAAALGGKTVWLTVESGEAPYETSGSYRLDLLANGTYAVPASGGIQARTGSWWASRPAEYLTIRLGGFHGDEVEDVLILFDGCPNCLSCGYSFHRENLPVGGQSGTFIMTDGEVPPAPSADIGVRGLTGGGVYQSGATVSLMVTMTYLGNPSTYKFQWSRDGVPVATDIPGFLSVPNVTPADSGVYRVAVSRSGVTNTQAATVTIAAPGTVPGYRVRVWERLSDWMSGLPMGRTWFRVNGGVVTIGGEKSVWRWAGGKLEQIVNSTTPGIDGINFSWVDAVTIESAGAFNFVVRNRLYEAAGGVITSIPTPGLSVGAVARSGNQVAFVGNGGGIQNGLYLWDGTILRTLVAPTLDLPGRLTRMESVRALEFDGERVVLLAFEGQQGAALAVTVGASPTLKLCAETGGTGPNAQTYRGLYDVSLRGDLIFLVAELSSMGTSVVSIERTGKTTRLGSGFSIDLVSAQLAASREREFHHVNAAAVERWSDAQFERYLGPGEALDGKTIKRFTSLDAQGEDVVAAVEFTDGTAALCGLLRDATPPVPLAIGDLILAGPDLNLTVPSVAGKSYTLESKLALSDPGWVAVQTVPGTGAPILFSVKPEGSTGFFRVVQQP